MTEFVVILISTVLLLLWLSQKIIRSYIDYLVRSLQQKRNSELRSKQVSKHYIPILPPDGEPGQHLAVDSSRGLYWAPPLKREDDDY
jgi:hypothetical protein